VYSLDYQYPTFAFDLANSLGHELAFVGRNVARFQRATQGAGKSTRRRGHEVVDGCRMGLLHLGVHAVVLRYL